MSLQLVGYEKVLLLTQPNTFDVAYVETASEENFHVWRRSKAAEKIQKSVTNVPWLDVLKDWVEPAPGKEEYKQNILNPLTARVVSNWIVFESPTNVFFFKIALYHFYVEDKDDSQPRQVLVRHKETNTNFKAELAANATLGDVPYSKIPLHVFDQIK